MAVGTVWAAVISVSGVSRMGVYRIKCTQCPGACLGSMWAPPISGGAAILPLSLFSRVLLAPGRTA